MIERRREFFLLACAALFALPGAVPQPATAQTPTTMRIRMVYPRTSTWGTVFNAWNNSLRTASGGTLQIHLDSAGSTGDEVQFVRDLRAGSVECASLSAIGLAEVDRSLLALQAPGAIASEAELDRVRTTLDTQLRQTFLDHGTVLMGWSDLGRARIFSTHAITAPDDLAHSHPWQLPSDPIFGELLTRVHATGVPLPLAGVMPALVSGQVDTVVASATAVSALQWHTHLTHVMRPSSAVLIGATVCSRSFYDGLTAEQRTALDTTAADAHTQLRARIRRADEGAYTALVGRGLVEDDATSHGAEWRAIAQQTRDALVGRLYTRAQLDAVMAATHP
jgi:TRAP-type C4-dicarboxylate transport system substrate-binding protein